MRGIRVEEKMGVGTDEDGLEELEDEEWMGRLPIRFHRVEVQMSVELLGIRELYVDLRY